MNWYNTDKEKFPVV